MTRRGAVLIGLLTFAAALAVGWGTYFVRGDVLTAVLAGLTISVAAPFLLRPMVD